MTDRQTIPLGDGPGPQERRWRNRVIWRLTGRWPDCVVQERLREVEHAQMEELDRWRKLERARLDSAS